MTATTGFGVPHTFTPRTRDIDALQYVYREVSKQQILAFCPNANVGANIADDFDIRWITIDNGGQASPVGDGDWIIRHRNQSIFEVLTEAAFARLYRPADTFNAGQVWLIQCTPDRHRREPRNVGVVLAVSTERVIGRFLGYTDIIEQRVELDLLVDILGAMPDTDYHATIGDFTDAIRADTWPDILVRDRRHPGILRVVEGDDSPFSADEQHRLATVFRGCVLPPPSK